MKRGIIFYFALLFLGINSAEAQKLKLFKDRDDNQEITVQLSDSINFYIKQHRQDSVEIEKLKIGVDSLRNELAILLPFKKEYTREQLSKAKATMQMDFHKMSKDVIAAMINKCGEFQGDPEFDSLNDELSRMLDIKNKFDNYSQLLYERVKIDSLSYALDNIEKSSKVWAEHCTVEQMSNINTLKDQLSETVDGVDFVASLIKDINEALVLDRESPENAQNSFSISDANAKIDDVIIGKKKYIDYYISKVPYLQKRYGLYIAELKKNPIAPNDIVVDIENEMLNTK